MDKKCVVCGEKTVFFVWCSSRNIDKQKIYGYICALTEHENVVCLKCAKEKGLLIDRPPLYMNKPRKYITWDEMRREDYRVTWR